MFYPCSPRQTSAAAALLEQGFPLVAIDRLPLDLEIDGVSTENHGAVHNVVSSYIKRGHRHIGFLATYKPSFSSVLERVRGYQDAMTEAGLNPDLNLRWIPEDPDTDFKVQIQLVHDTISSLRAQADPISALVCLEDSLGSAALLACSRLGITTPEDLEIATFNDWQPISILQPWNVWRIVQQKYNTGFAAADLLLKRLANPNRPFEVVRVEAEFIPFDAGPHEDASPSIKELIPANEGPTK